MPTKTSDTKGAVQRVQQRIDRLSEEQSQAIKQAVYVGMTRDASKKYDERLGKIMKLVAELARLRQR